MQLYMNGDDHHLEVLRDDHQITYLITGAGSYVHDVPMPHAPESLWAAPQHGFATHELFQDVLRTRIVSEEGEELYSVVVHKNRTYGHGTASD